MRIALIIPGFCADADDWCIPAHRNLVLELTKTHRLVVYASRYPARRDTYRVGAATVKSFGGKKRRGFRAPLIWADCLRSLRADHRAHPFDVVHGFWGGEAGVLAVLAGRWLGIPSLVTFEAPELVHIPDIGYGWQRTAAGRWRVHYIATRADRLITLSALQAKAAENITGVTPVEYHYGIETSIFRRQGPAMPLAGKPAILCAASLVPVKDHHTLLKAFATFCAKAAFCAETEGAHLHLLGQGPLETGLRALASHLGLGGRVTFHGAIAHDRMGDYFRGADFCVLSSRSESYGCVVLEALLCGRLTVGCAVGILPQITPADYRCPPGDAAGLTRTLLAAARGQKNVTDHIKLSSLDAAQRFSLANGAREMEKIYRATTGHRYPAPTDDRLE